MDNTQEEDSCVSNVAEITARDLQLDMGIFMIQHNKCELKQFLCDIKFKRKQIKLCREFNPDLRFLRNSIVHHRKSIVDPREAERLLGLVLKITKALKKEIKFSHIMYLSLSAQLYCICYVISVYGICYVSFYIVAVFP